MSIFRQLDRETIKNDFTHKGLLLGVVPIYLSATDARVDLTDPLVVDDVIICERNGVPEIMVPIAAALVEVVVWLLNFGGLWPAFPTKYPIIVTGVV